MKKQMIVELGRTKISGQELRVEYGRCELESDTINSLLGRHIMIHNEADENNQEVYNIFLKDQLLAKGYAKLICDETGEWLGNGVVITNVVNNRANTVGLKENLLIKLDGEFISPKKANEPKNRYWAYNVYIDNVLTAKGSWLSAGTIGSDGYFKDSGTFGVRIEELV